MLNQINVETMESSKNQPSEDLTRFVYRTDNDDKPGVSNLPPRIKCVFHVRPFGEKFMAFVSCFDEIKLQHVGDGNILHGLHSLPYKELIAKLDSYTQLSEIEKDFDFKRSI